MRKSDLAFVLPKLQVGGREYYLLHWHRKWSDWSLIGGHVEAWEASNWRDAAVREADEELTPLRSGFDFEVERVPVAKLEWGPVPSRSNHDAPTLYRAEYYGLRFLVDPLVSLKRLPARSFALFDVEAWCAGGLSDTLARVARQLKHPSIPLSWSETVSAESLPRELIQSAAVGA